MLTAIQEGDEVFLNAIELATAEERDAYLAQACGHDAALMQQIKKRVAEYLHNRNGSKEPEIAASAVPCQTSHDRTSVPQAHRRDDLPPPAQALPEENKGWKIPASLKIAGKALLLTSAVIGIFLSVWAIQTEKKARKIVERATADRDNTAKIIDQHKLLRAEAEAAHKATDAARAIALVEKKRANDSVADLKALLAFFQHRVSSAGHPAGWSGGQGKDVTLRKAVDAAQSRVAEVFAKRPIAEAGIREILGLTYLDLDAPTPAVKEYERACGLREALQGEEHPDTVSCRNQLAVAYRLANRHGDAGRLFHSNNHSSTRAATLALRGSQLLEQSKPVQAEQSLRACLTLRQKNQPDEWTTFETESLLGESLFKQGKYANAESLLLSGYQGMKVREAKIPVQDKPRLIRAIERLLQLYEASGKKERAAEWRKEWKTAKVSKAS